MRFPLIATILALAVAGSPVSASAAVLGGRTPDVAQPGVVLSNLLSNAAVRLQIEPPYRTQLDGSKYAISNCGPAVLGMALAAYGMESETIDLREAMHTYQGTWPGRGGTALQHVAHVADDFGVATHGLYDEPEAFHRWTVDEIAEQVALGRMVISLVRYGALPGHETTGVRWGHYILIYAIEGDGLLYQDSAFRPIEQGRARWISRDQLDRAMGPTLVPYQAVALGALSRLGSPACSACR